tara:strand:- start:287 stop:910 length:624 start_codon:yes stop_codon:yes gene_type:complete
MNNLEKINNFFTDNKKNLLILNKINEEIICLYRSFISHFGEKNQINIEYRDELKIDNEVNDLFGFDKIYMTSTNSKKNIQNLSSQNTRVILFTDYKNFKIFQNTYQSINTYNFENDINTFINKYLGINDINLFDNIVSHPSSFYSEVSKYLVNKENYSKNSSLSYDKNFILDIRKNIFDIKKNGNLRELFLKLKEEVNYKKFSFLTY